ncbi:helix-turn-helix domain-containing protein [Bacillus sp. SIMBA_005]|uniref:helix-turn-helix domain-containing protein n=1 Tax=Bacillus sp. SIMBA_005 TaxID=3085754 RepID=UPI0039799D7B
MVISSEIFGLIRMAKGMTQAEYGAFLGISKSSVAAIECGDRRITKKTQHAVISNVNFDETLIAFLDKYEKAKLLAK